MSEPEGVYDYSGVIEYLVRSGFLERREAVGCSEAEIEEIRIVHGVTTLPEALVSALRLFGKSQNLLARSKFSDLYGYPSILMARAELEEHMRDPLSEGYLFPYVIREGDIVFGSHGGWRFLCVSAKEGPDPEVIRYEEGSTEVVHTERSLSQYLIGLTRWPHALGMWIRGEARFEYERVRRDGTRASIAKPLRLEVVRDWTLVNEEVDSMFEDLVGQVRAEYKNVEVSKTVPFKVNDSRLRYMATLHLHPQGGERSRPLVALEVSCRSAEASMDTEKAHLYVHSVPSGQLIYSSDYVTLPDDPSSEEYGAAVIEFIRAVHAACLGHVAGIVGILSTGNGQ